MGDQRGEIEARVAEEMQQTLDGYQVRASLIQGVAIKQADPPAAVNDAFKEVTAAQQDAQSYVNQANAYALQLRQKAQGEATAFDKVYEQYKLAPEVTRRRMYYETMERVLRQVDKTIVEAPGVTPYLPLRRSPRSAAAGRSRHNDRPGPPPPAAWPASPALLLLFAAAQQRSRSSPKPSRRSSSASASRCGSSTATSPGSPIGAAGAGISLRIPFAEDVVWIDKRVLDVDMDRQQVLSTDQLRLEVDAFARYRIVDPLRMYIRARSEDRVEPGAAADPRLGAAQRARQAAVRVAAVARARGRDGEYPQRPRPRRAAIWRRDHRRPDQEGRPARRHAARSRLSTRMRTARQQEARSIRAEGAKRAQIIRAEADAAGGQDLCRELRQGPGIL